MNDASAPRYPGAWDCHIHVYEDRYPLAPTATFKPPHAPAADYLAVRRALGIAHTLVVQPTGYGFDNSCLVEALQQLGPDTRGIAVVPPDVPEAELQRLHQAGVRGVRFMMLAGGVLPWDSLEPVAARIAPLGWVIDLQLDGRDLPLHEERLAQLPARLVIDHIGKFLEPVNPEHPSFRSLQRLLDGGRCWIKVSAPYETSRRGPPDYADVTPLASALAQQHTERCLWASNWPHPNIQPTPSNEALLAWFERCAGGEAVARRILVENTGVLFGA